MARPPNRIRELRKARKLSLARLAELADTSAQQINRLERGERKLTDEWKLRLAAPLRCRPADLVDLDIASIDFGPNLVPITERLQYIPIVTWVEAGKLSEGVQTNAEDQELVPVVYNRDTLVALRVIGDSMNLTAPEGAVIVVDYEDRNPVDRKFYVFRWNGEVGFKQYRSSDGPPRFEPYSSDPSHKTIYPDGEVEIIGRVVKVMQEM